MTKNVIIVLVWTLLCSGRCFAQLAEGSNGVEIDGPTPESSAPLLRNELKQYVSKMTFESGERRILLLPTRVQSRKIQRNNGSTINSAAESSALRQSHERLGQISVQCNPLGEADAIGVIPDTYKKPQKRRSAVEIYASDDVDFSLDKWRRLAELACLEDEI